MTLKLNMNFSVSIVSWVDVPIDFTYSLLEVITANNSALSCVDEA